MAQALSIFPFTGMVMPACLQAVARLIQAKQQLLPVEVNAFKKFFQFHFVNKLRPLTFALRNEKSGLKSEHF